MRLGKAISLGIVLAVSALAAGCAGGLNVTDPFAEETATPAGPYSPYLGAGERAPALGPVEVPKRPLTLAECISLALRYNPQVRISWQQARAAAATVGQARAAYLPQLDLQATARRVQRRFILAGEANVIDSTYQVTFGVKQLLLDFGARKGTLGAARAALESANFMHNSTMLDVALDTELKYYQLLAAQSVLDVANKAVEQRMRHVKLAQQRYQAGMGRMVEVLQAQSKEADAEQDAVQARSQVRIFRGRLASSMGLPVTTPIEIVPISETTYTLQTRDIQKLLAMAARNRPKLKAAVAEVNRLRQALRVHRAGRWPELTGSGSYGWRDTKAFPDTGNDEWDIAAVLKVPLFRGFQQTYKIREAAANLDAAISNYERSLRDVELEVWEGYSGVIQADEAIRAAEASVSAAQESLNVIESGYKQGRATIVELIDAQTDLTRALFRRVKTRLDWHVAVARLERAVGKGLGLIPARAAAPAALTASTLPGSLTDAADPGGRKKR